MGRCAAGLTAVIALLRDATGAAESGLGWLALLRRGERVGDGRRADRALYEAKQAGRDRAVLA